MIEVQNEEKGKGSSRVKVAIRIRPMIEKQSLLREKSCIDYEQDNMVVIGKDRLFTFDKVFRENSTQQDVYDGCVKQLVMGCFQGYNAAILAYGQTGSGKTYTMGTTSVNFDEVQEMGIIPRVIEEFFAQISKPQSRVEHIIRASFIEIYNQQIIDLLSHQHVKNSKDNKGNCPTIREEKDGSVTVCGVHEERVTEPEQMIDLLNRGALNRSTSSTLMNDSSSRSHGIFTIFLEQHPIDQTEEGFITAKFYFVDLAGSERVKKTGASGLTFKEGININLGLLELGNVISALSANNQKKQGQFITFRNSKLTRILQDSLGGNSNTYMIACISPAQSNYEESLNTLKYASKAMNIKNKPKINRDPHSAQINSLKQRILDLQQQNKSLHETLEKMGIQPIFKKRDPRNDILSDEIKRLKTTIMQLEKALDQKDQEIQFSKELGNQIQVKHYQTCRELDIMTLKMEKIRFHHPDVIITDGNEEQEELLQTYRRRMSELQKQNYTFEKQNTKLQSQLEKIEKAIEKSDEILIQKNKEIYRLKNNIKQLTQEKRSSHMKSIQNKVDSRQSFSAYQSEDMDIEEDGMIDHDDDEEDGIHESNEQQLRGVSDRIQAQQRQLQIITEEKINLQYQLIAEIKEDYHKKIEQIQKQKQMVANQISEKQGFEKNQKLKNKIQNLQIEVRQYRKKIQEQKTLEQKVNMQSEKIKNMTNEIKQFKLQKIELNRKIKENKNKFEELKMARNKQIMKCKKENIKKDGQIRKLQLENKKKSLMMFKKAEQIKRVKKINETIKILLKQNKQKVKKGGRNKSLQNRSSINNQIPQNQIARRIQESIDQIMIEEKHKVEANQYEDNIVSMEQEMEKLYDERSSIQLIFNKLQVSNNEEQQQKEQKRKYSIQMDELEERIGDLQQKITFYENKFREMEKTSSYDLDKEIIYYRKFSTIDSLRFISECLYKIIKELCYNMIALQSDVEKHEAQCEVLKEDNNSLKQYNMQMTTEYQTYISEMRQEMMTKYFTSAEQTHEVMYGSCKGKIDEREKRMYEKKIYDLKKTNSHLAKDAEMWRRKCSIVNEKYQSNRMAKDKYIGLPPREEDKDKSTTNSTRNQSMLGEVHGLINCFDSNNRVRKNFTSDDQLISGVENSNEQLNRNKWQCIATIPAHNGGVLSLCTHENTLISSATRSIKIWDSEKNQLIIDLTHTLLSGFVKSILVDADKKLLVSACERQVHLFDLRSYEHVGALKAHRDEIRTLYKEGAYLFSAGKGTMHSGAMFKWDTRGDLWQPIEEKQKNSDVFAMASHERTLYYGTRNHQVRRMNIDSMDVLSPFEPPHMDTVTGVTVLKNQLISGSKDKNLRLWSLYTSTNNVKSTIHAFNDYINCLTSDKSLPTFYSGSRDGQVKIAAIRGEKIHFLGSIIAHTQAINTICSFEQPTGALATGSSDRTIKIWKPTPPTLQNLQRECIYN